MRELQAPLKLTAIGVIRVETVASAWQNLAICIGSVEFGSFDSIEDILMALDCKLAVIGCMYVIE